MKKNIYKIVFSFLLIIALVGFPSTIKAASTWDGTAATYEWYGDGSATEYHLTSASDLYGFAKLVSGLASLDADNFTGKVVYLDVDIDLGNHEWTPIGGGYTITEDPPYITFNYGAGTFKGTFNGQNHYIDNLEMTDLSTAGGTLLAGFFSCTENATVKNLTFKNADVQALGTRAEIGTAYLGILVGEATGGNFENITITGSQIKANNDVGGLFGAIGGGAQIKNCHVTADVFGGNYVGGLTGQIGGAGANSTATTASTPTVKIVDSGFYGDLYIDGGFSTGYLTATYAWAGYVYGSVASYTVVDINEFTVGADATLTTHTDLKTDTRGNIVFNDGDTFLKGDTKFEIFGGIGRGGFNTGILKYTFDGITYTSEKAESYFFIDGVQTTTKNVTMKNNANVTITNSLTVKGNLTVPTPDSEAATFTLGQTAVANSVFKDHGYLVVGSGAKLVVTGTLTAGTDYANILGTDETSLLVTNKTYHWDTTTSKWVAEETPSEPVPVGLDEEDGFEYKIVAEELNETNQDLVDSYIEANEEMDTTENTYIITTVDISLQRKEDGSNEWEDVNVDGTLNILIPYPEGTNKADFNFKILHFTSLDPVEAEELAYVKTDQGLLITTTGLSPVTIIASKVADNPKTIDGTYFYIFAALIAFLIASLSIYKIKKYN